MLVVVSGVAITAAELARRLAAQGRRADVETVDQWLSDWVQWGIVERELTNPPTYRLSPHGFAIARGLLLGTGPDEEELAA